jgi:hypothetical protein
MQTAESEEFTSPIAYIPKTSFHPNSSSSCQWLVKHSSERRVVKLARSLPDCRDYYLLLPRHTILSPYKYSCLSSQNTCVFVLSKSL